MSVSTYETQQGPYPEHYNMKSDQPRGLVVRVSDY